MCFCYFKTGIILGLGFVQCLLFPSIVLAQTTPQKIKIGFKKTPILEAFDQIKQVSKVKLAYDPSEINPKNTLTLPKEVRTVQTLFSEISKQVNLNFIPIRNTIVITPRISRKIEKMGVVVSTDLLPLNGQVFVEGTALGLGGVNITIKGSNKGTVTDHEGKFQLNAPPSALLVFTSLGFEKQETILGERQNLRIFLKEENQQLQDVMVVGSRTNQSRSSVDAVSPIDIFTAKDLAQTGQTDVGLMLAFVAPSFNSSRQTIADGTDHIDPMTLRGLGPDQVLVLVNGKRRHSTALVNVNSTVGRGSVGTDLNAIPASQIERIEILRDGASAQYGSDAIAGVINIVLKKYPQGGQLTSQVGQTAEADGQVAQLALNKGWNISKKGGFLNISAESRFRNPTNRSGQYNGLVYLPALPNTASQTAITENLLADQALIVQRNFNLRPMIVGNSQSLNFSGFYNLGLPLAKLWEFYSFGGINQRFGKSAGFYRFPNNSRTNNLDIYPNGYLPYILTNIQDQSLTLGLRKMTKNDWNFDFSNSYGANAIGYNVENSLNASMRNTSPTTFDVGQLKFSQNTTNINISRNIKPSNPKSYINIALGAELRLDNYQILAGQESSYLDANLPNTPLAQIKAAGSQVFNGFRPTNALNKTRRNLGIYTDIETEIDEKLLINGAIRFEDYSDFGSNISGKLVSRYLFKNGFSLRGGINLGFRAPSLHQKYYSTVSTQFITINGLNQQREVSTLNNETPLVRALGVPQLLPETSTSYSVGMSAKLGTGLLLTVDTYWIDIQNRIVLSGRFSSTVPQIASYFKGTSVTEAQFFTNAINTSTRGIDLILNHKNRFYNGDLNLTAALNFNRTLITDVKVSQQLVGLGETLFNREERGRIEVNQPRSKMVFSAQYQQNRFSATLRATRFGQISTIAPQDPTQDQTFRAKVLTDFMLSYSLNSKFSLSMGVNNLFDVYPDKVADPRLTNNNTVVYSRFATQFGFNGAYYFTGLKFSW